MKQRSFSESELVNESSDMAKWSLSGAWRLAVYKKREDVADNQ